MPNTVTVRMVVSNNNHVATAEPRQERAAEEIGAVGHRVRDKAFAALALVELVVFVVLKVVHQVVLGALALGKVFVGQAQNSAVVHGSKHALPVVHG